MIIYKAYRSWVHLGPMPIFRALVLDGATYYFIFILAFCLEIVANMSNVVCRIHLAVFNPPLLIGYSFIIP
jgi:hypothetical protein